MILDENTLKQMESHIKKGMKNELWRENPNFDILLTGCCRLAVLDELQEIINGDSISRKYYGLPEQAKGKRKVVTVKELREALDKYSDTDYVYINKRLKDTEITSTPIVGFEHYNNVLTLQDEFDWKEE